MITAQRVAFRGGVLITLFVLAVAAAACSKASATAPTARPTPSASNPTTFSFTSDPASRVGRGQSPTYTVENATFQVATDSQFIMVSVLPIGTTDWLWRFRLDPPRGQKLVAGTFPVARPAQASGIGFEFAGAGNACGTGSGTVAIEAIDNSGGLVDHLRMNFSVMCDGTPAVNGRIVLNWVAGVGYR
jgi:hypothetical protein